MNAADGCAMREPLIPLVAQLASCADYLKNEERRKRREAKEKAKAARARNALAPEIVARLDEHRIARRTYDRYKKEFGRRELTIKELLKSFKTSRQAVYQQVAKLQRGGFVASVGKTGQDVIWMWVAK
jgi:hypothetical protein